jgi:hypothetical protein
VEEESTSTVMAGLPEVIEKQRLFSALYSDRGSHFVTPKAGQQVDQQTVRRLKAGAKPLA